MIWQASYTPFGQATVNADPDNNGTFYVQNFRLPGQYYDAETGLHYNYQRDYNPRSGRYLTGDPLGFGGGSLNLYAYCGGDPVNWIGPTGEMAGVLTGAFWSAFIPLSVRLAATAALLRIMPESADHFLRAFDAFITFFNMLIWERATIFFLWQGLGKYPVPDYSPADVPGEGAQGYAAGEAPSTDPASC